MVNLPFIQLLKEKSLAQDREWVSRWNQPSIDETQHFRGYSEEEVQSVMTYQEVDFLPEIYWQFLLEMGHNSGILLTGSSCMLSYEEHALRKQAFKEYVLSTQHCSESYQLPEQIFVIAWDVDDFFFFETAEKNEDPPVYYYHDCFSKAIRVSETLSDWLLTQAFYNPVYWAQDHFHSNIVDAWKHLQSDTDEEDDIPF